MKHLILSLLAFVAALVPLSLAQAEPVWPKGLSDDEKIFAADHAGPITSKTTEAELVKRFGKKNVKRAEIHIIESEMADGTILFPDDPELALEIVWADAEKRARPDFARVSGERSLWRTAEGITLGSTLMEVQKANGKPFTLNGMGWDMGGGVTDWQDGVLASYLQPEVGAVLLSFDYPPGDVNLTEKESSSISGEREVSSNFPALRKLNPIVTKLLVSFTSAGEDE